MLDRLRSQIETEHAEVTIEDVPHFYDLDAFNRCAQRGCLMESLDMWAQVHPGLITLPIAWDYALPYGIVYAAEPSEATKAFVDAIARLAPSHPTAATRPRVANVTPDA